MVVVKYLPNEYKKLFFKCFISDWVTCYSILCHFALSPLFKYAMHLRLCCFAVLLIIYFVTGLVFDFCPPIVPSSLFLCIQATIAAQRAILDQIDINLKRPIPYCDQYYTSTTTTTTTTTTTVTGSTAATTTATTTGTTTTSWDLLTIPLCLNRPKAATNGTAAATSTVKSAGRRRREVELYEPPSPRFKRAIMTVCDPRQVFGAKINWVDDRYFKVRQFDSKAHVVMDAQRCYWSF